METSFNIVLVGPSQVGKTTIVRALLDIHIEPSSKGFSQTREPESHRVVVTNSSCRQFNLNFIDTPGLREVMQYASETRSDKQLLDQLTQFFSRSNVRTIDCLCFVSQAGRTHQQDIQIFETFMKCFGSRCSSKSMMILTCCESYSDEKLTEIVNDLHSHHLSRPIMNYCQHGVFYHGIVDFDDLQTYTNQPDLREQIYRSKFGRVSSMRQQLIDGLTSVIEKSPSIVYDVNAGYGYYGTYSAMEIDGSDTDLLPRGWCCQILLRGCWMCVQIWAFYLQICWFCLQICWTAGWAGMLKLWSILVNDG